MTIEMRMPYSSNSTFLVSIIDKGELVKAIYKPMRGEKPLWDFEPGLHRREVAAYRLAEAMGLHFVPPTILRDGPQGEGSVQLLIEANPDEHYFAIFEERQELHDQFRAMCAFDIVANNTDRKSGHVLVDKDSRVWGIDHGLCFAQDFKIRTVIWEFGGEAIAESLLEKIEPLTQTVPLEVATLLTEQEVIAITERAKWLLDGARFPVDPSGRHYPWPLV
ncbi:MAG: SCO1664 family protein [Actinobacteria bacterium]|nr:SCO1664 family protein [Actinomycetota bacterium]MTA65623.1 SCO1664 family protein [Actinomycetota bacterium]